MRLFKLFILITGCFLLGQAARPQADSIERRIVLVGDAGEMQHGKHPELDLVRQLFNFSTTPTTIVYLGDNIYPRGLPDSLSADFPRARAILDDQVALVKGQPANAYFIPGNHDWMQGASPQKAWQQVLHQGAYINSLELSNIHFLPENGCPGPVEVPLSDNVVMVVMDSQWWLQPNPKPGAQSGCPCRNPDEILTRLNDIVYRNRDKILLFASHHPMKTYGIHGGYFTFKQHLFPFTDFNRSLYIPLPVIGSIYPITRGVFGNIQDTRHPIYKQMVRSVEEVLDKHAYCIRIAGHDHGLQLIHDHGRTYIVSGGGSKSTRVKKGRGTAFARASTGFAVLEVLHNGTTWLKYYSSADPHPGAPLYAEQLPTHVPAATTAATLPTARPALPDSAVFTGYTEFHAGPVKRFFLGSNYRREWQAPVKAPVLDITKQFGGLRTLQRGGGHQTKSLRMADSAGNEYVLRSVDKNPTEEALPVELRGTFVIDLVKDGVSSSYPYSALSVPPLAVATGVPHASPTLFYVPDDPAFGIYQKEFANGLFWLEERQPDADGKTYSTPRVMEKIQEDQDNRIDQAAVLKARMLDMFMMDFDRHEDQWRWGFTDTKKGKTFYPIPRDRDQAFFINTGLIPSLAGRNWVTPQIQGMRVHARDIKTFNFNARNFDRNFLNALSAAEWKQQAIATIGQMTDSVITAAIRLQPSSIYPWSGDKIIATLKARRNYLVQEAMEYYAFLARVVSIGGTDKRELFDITRHEDGSVTVNVFKINKSGDISANIYDRTFLYGETKEIRLYGMGGDDKFVLHGNAQKTIKVRIIGGAGADDIDNRDSLAPASKTVVYDLSTEANHFTGSMLQRLSKDPSVNNWDRLGFKYNVLAPFLSVNYNADDGIYLGVALKYTVQGFHKEPFKLQHNLIVNHSLATQAYNFKYGLDVTDAVGKADFLLRSELRAPNNTINFFGLGNESIYDKSGGKKISYYRTRFTLGDLAMMLRIKPAQHISISAGPAFQYFSMDQADNKNRFITLPALNGLDSASLFKTKAYLGAQIIGSIDNRNNKIIPSRGINWETKLRYNYGLNAASRSFTQLSSELSLFTSFSSSSNIVIATRFGGGINFGGYEFYQAQFLSGTENLRGFRKYRFAGDKMAYNNTELRIKLADFQTYLFPGRLGLLLFNDVGQVWTKGSPEGSWHDGYGAGLWVAPLGRFVVTVSATHSDEGTLPLVSFGFQF